VLSWLKNRRLWWRCWKHSRHLQSQRKQTNNVTFLNNSLKICVSVFLYLTYLEFCCCCTIYEIHIRFCSVHRKQSVMVIFGSTEIEVKYSSVMWRSATIHVTLYSFRKKWSPYCHKSLPCDCTCIW
jgi:hypothetical protein